jgi:hypothetical protein
MKDFKLKNESKYYILNEEDMFLINEVLLKRKAGLFTGIVFRINKFVHIDFLDFNSKVITICDNIL